MTYNEFISNIITTRGQWNIPEGEYFEKHHIVPKCMGGSNDKENIIWLYAKEHFTAHRLLAEENPNNYKILYAFGAMCSDNKGLREAISEEEYELARKANSLASSIKNSGSGNPMYGKSAIKGKHVHSEEYKETLRARVTGEGNPMWGKTIKETFSEESYENFKLKNKLNAQNYWDNLTEEEYKNRCKLVTGKNNGMWGKYGKSSNSVKVKCIETGDIFVSICDAERQLGISGIKRASKIGTTAGGYHWERLTDSF